MKVILWIEVLLEVKNKGTTHIRAQLTYSHLQLQNINGERKVHVQLFDIFLL